MAADGGGRRTDPGPGPGSGRPRGRQGGRQAGRQGGSALTGRAAILAVVVCAIALTLAYPVREYIAQRQEIADLRHKQAVAQKQVAELEQRKKRLTDKSYIEREAKRRLHYCMPHEKCYIVLDGGTSDGEQAQRKGSNERPPWYETLWRSVETADRTR
ncbi:septum formation initiator family protein [Actinomadura logoneensis]|uniref:Septum formation initiator family protein n=1 Tax=Actinomadura logoneensis TaxID=2293572 RepID=A0A372JE43_9ACTN|nr:septum formation initiator family protein [Actinomadura logoneensis]RFU38281.1 septum formation initiator family protein [Actinomadura logoneensis]